MLFIFLLSGFLLCFFFFVLSKRNRYWYFSFNSKAKIKECIIRLPTNNILHKKLLREVTLFNSLYLVAGCRSGVAVEYINQVSLLMKDIKYRENGDAYQKLFYAYANYVLLHKVDDFFIKRQLKNNLRWVFLPKIKIVKNIRPVLCGKRFYTYPPVPYKIFNNSFVAMTSPEFRTEKKTTVTVCDSFIVYRNADIEIKRFEGLYSIYTKNEQRIILTVAPDKDGFDCNISRGLVKCINLINGEVKKYKITGDKIRLATSVAEKTDALEIYVTCVGKAVISVDGAKERLLSFTEIEYNKRAEQIISAAYNSKFVAGQNLLQRYNSVEKEIPSMRLLSVVYEITDADVFITVIEEVELYKKIAKLFGGFNIIFLYSGGNDFAAKLVSGFIGRDDIGELYKSNCFMYFIDRVTTSVDTIYFLSRMKIASEQKRAVQNGEIMADSPHIAVNEINGKTYPYTKTVVLQNADKKQQIVTAAVSVILGGMSVVSCDGKVVTVVGLYSHRTDIYKLPQDAKVCIKNEIITDRIEVIIKTRLSGYEQKKFPIIKNEGVLSPKERKSQFLKSIENICVVSTDAEFSGIFAKNVTEKETPQVLFAVKSAVRNADRKLFISVLSGRNEIGADTWAYLLNKIIGIRNIKNSVQIVPDISITGDFSLSFDYNGQTHNFSIVKNGGGCAINYGSEKGNNFLEIPFDQK